MPEVSEVIATDISTEATPINTAAPAKAARKARKAAKEAGEKTPTKKKSQAKSDAAVKRHANAGNTSVKPAKAKPAKTPKVSKPKTAAKPQRDDARAVSKASGGKLDTDQVRILRVLRDAKGKELVRDDIKEGVGIVGKYSSGWLKSLCDLRDRSLIAIDKYENAAAYVHTIKPAGKVLIEKAEAASKAAAK